MVLKENHNKFANLGLAHRCGAHSVHLFIWTVVAALCVVSQSLADVTSTSAPAPTSLPAAHADGVTPQRAIELALQNSPSLHAMAFQLAEDEAKVHAALSLRNPELRTSLESSELWFPALEGRAYEEPLSNASIDLRWSPPNLGSWSARRARAERFVDQTAAAIQTERREVAAQALLLHAKAQSYDAQLALAQTATDLRDRLRALIKRRLDANAATALEGSLAELDYLDAVAERTELESERQETQYLLRLMLGVAEGQDLLLVTGDLNACQAPAADVDAMVRLALQRSPIMVGHDARLAEVDADLSRAYLEILPWFDFIQVGYVTGKDDTRFALGGSTDNAALRVRFGLTFPLFNFNGAEIEALQARKARLGAEHEADVLRLERRIRRDYDELKGRIALRDRFVQDDGSVVEQSLGLINRALELGEADLMQMALIQSRALRARRARLRAELRCQESAIELWRLAGDTLDGSDEYASVTWEKK